MHWILSWTLLATFCTAAFAQDTSSSRPARKVQRRAIAPVTPKKSVVNSEKLIDSYILNFGSHTEFFNNVQTDDSGSLRKFDFAPTIGLGADIPMESGFNFLPEFNWVLPRKAGSSKILKNLLMLRADFGYDPIDWLRVRVGTSILWLNQHGSGGSAQVNNGNGTSTFYYPDENRSSFNNTLDLGVEARMEEWSVRLQTYIYSVFREDRRQLSYTLFVSYYWDNK